MEVFHGTTLIVNTPLVGVGRKNLDFGEGFYLTSIRQQAIDWAQRPINKDKPQYLNCYELDLSGISKNDYRYLKFEAYDDEWLDFVILRSVYDHKVVLVAAPDDLCRHLAAADRNVGRRLHGSLSAAACQRYFAGVGTVRKS